MNKVQIQAMLDQAGIDAAALAVSKEVFQDQFHQNVSLSASLANKDVSIDWNTSKDGTVGVTVGENHFMVNYTLKF
jgi:hypothetical protein